MKIRLLGLLAALFFTGSMLLSSAQAQAPPESKLIRCPAAIGFRPAFTDSGWISYGGMPASFSLAEVVANGPGNQPVLLCSYIKDGTQTLVARIYQPVPPGLACKVNKAVLFQFDCVPGIKKTVIRPQ